MRLNTDYVLTLINIMYFVEREQAMIFLSEHLRSHPNFGGVRLTFFVCCFVDLFVSSSFVYSHSVPFSVSLTYIKSIFNIHVLFYFLFVNSVSYILNILDSIYIIIFDYKKALGILMERQPLLLHILFEDHLRDINYFDMPMSYYLKFCVISTIRFGLSKPYI